MGRTRDWIPVSFSAHGTFWLAEGVPVIKTHELIIQPNTQEECRQTALQPCKHSHLYLTCARSRPHDVAIWQGALCAVEATLLGPTPQNSTSQTSILGEILGSVRLGNQARILTIGCVLCAEDISSFEGTSGWSLSCLTRKPLGVMSG